MEQSKIKSLIQEFYLFRKLIYKDHLHILKHEYIHILYQVYKKIIKRIFIIFIQPKANFEQKKSFLFIFAKK